MDASSTSFADPPFACPPDVVIDLPVPPSVNLMRRIDFRHIRQAKAWKEDAHVMLMAAGFKPKPPINRFEIFIVISEAHTGCDLDNLIKVLIDYLRLIEVIENDAPKNLRKLTVEWGCAPEGTRITVRPCE